MSNMNYCMFWNTCGDLEDAKTKLEEVFHEQKELSESEAIKMKDLLELCRDIVEEYEDRVQEYVYQDGNYE